MDTKSAIIALMSVWGVGACVTPAIAQDSNIVSEESADLDADLDNPLLNRVWIRDEDGGLPGPMQIFLEDGTLISDSCWETYRLSNWQQISETAISWDEDGITINADIVIASMDELVLKLHLVGAEVLEQRFVPAKVPYVCPDMPK